MKVLKLKTKNYMKTIILFLMLMFISFCGFSQTSVYMDLQNGAIGYSSGYAATPTYAYNMCLNNGGKNPYKVVYSTAVGYAAIYVGYTVDGNKVIGVATGKASLQEAIDAAYTTCYNYGGKYRMVFVDSFYDAVLYQ